mmetsp:Transcript_6291/g.14192  ORF Transcript_6291/g.14192 Transcript_6291/m.14192 type:complete len:210 (+) Transcript_6291:1791-2420(+)
MRCKPFLASTASTNSSLDNSRTRPLLGGADSSFLSSSSSSSSSSNENSWDSSSSSSASCGSSGITRDAAAVAALGTSSVFSSAGDDDMSACFVVCRCYLFFFCCNCWVFISISGKQCCVCRSQKQKQQRFDRLVTVETARPTTDETLPACARLWEFFRSHCQRLALGVWLPKQHLRRRRDGETQCRGDRARDVRPQTPDDTQVLCHVDP